LNRHVAELMTRLEEHGYVAEREVATAIHLSLALEKPLLIEGPAGVGKTDIARVLAEVLDTNLIRLQCYEGLDATSVLYEWNYLKQLLAARLMAGDPELSNPAPGEGGRRLFTWDFLIPRPLLQAIIQEDKAPVLLIDEVDRGDEELESFLLEVLDQFQVTIPELGTVKARHRPRVVLTSNRTRELSEALRRRCLYLWMGYPSWEKELRIVQKRVPGIERRLAEQVCRLVQQVRSLDLVKVPGLVETLDLCRALQVLHLKELTAEALDDLLGVLLKDEADITALRQVGLHTVLERALAASPTGGEG